jgi:hypothetical protein
MVCVTKRRADPTTWVWRSWDLRIRQHATPPLTTTLTVSGWWHQSAGGIIVVARGEKRNYSQREYTTSSRLWKQYKFSLIDTLIYNWVFTFIALVLKPIYYWTYRQLFLVW